MQAARESRLTILWQQSCINRLMAHKHEPGEPQQQTGIPPRQHQNKMEVDRPNQTGRPRNEGPDTVERSGPQPARSEAPGRPPPDTSAGERSTM